MRRNAVPSNCGYISSPCLSVYSTTCHVRIKRERETRPGGKVGHIIVDVQIRAGGGDAWGIQVPCTGDVAYGG